MTVLSELKDSAHAKVKAIRDANRYIAEDAVAKDVLDRIQLLKDTHPIRVYVSCGEYAAFVAVHIKDLEGMQDPRLMSALELLVKANPEQTESRDLAAYRERTFTFRWRAHIEGEHVGTMLTVEVNASVKEDSATCKRVVVGYKEPKVDPEPIYKLECSDGTPEEVLTAAKEAPDAS
jgi:hypothetical protein